MPRGDKQSYTDQQRRQARHIEESYEAKGVDPDEAEARAWATVNRQDGGGKRSGAGRASHDRSAAARKGWETRRNRG